MIAPGQNHRNLQVSHLQDYQQRPRFTGVPCRFRLEGGLLKSLMKSVLCAELYRVIAIFVH